MNISAIVTATIIILGSAFLARYLYRISGLKENVFREVEIVTKYFVILFVLYILSPNIHILWILILVATLNFFKGRRDVCIIVYIALFTALPQMGYEYLWPVNFGSLGYAQVLSIGLLLPVYIQGLDGKITFQEKLLAILLTAMVVFDFRAGGNVVTSSARGFVSYFTDFYLPFSVACRAIRTKEQIHAALAAIVFGSLMRLLPMLYEFVRSWNIYNLTFVLVGERQELLFRRYRAGFIRVSATFYNPIVHGYNGGVALISAIYLSRFLKRKFLIPYYAVGSLSVVVAFSKGPWLATAVAFCYLFFTDKAFPRGKAFSAVLLVVIGLSLSPVGETLYGMIPFVGDISQESEDYRQDLLKQSWIVFQENPWAGLPTRELYAHPAMQVMLQGQGIIDITNYYLQLLLEYGIFVAGIFILMSVSVLVGIRRVVKQYASIYISYEEIGSQKEKERNTIMSLGHTFFALIILSSIVLSIISSIDRILNIHLIVLALGICYCRVYGNMSEIGSGSVSEKDVLQGSPDREKQSVVSS